MYLVVCLPTALFWCIFFKSIYNPRATRAPIRIERMLKEFPALLEIDVHRFACHYCVTEGASNGKKMNSL